MHQNDAGEARIELVTYPNPKFLLHMPFGPIESIHTNPGA